MSVPPHEILKTLEPVAEEGRAQAAFLRPLIQQAQEQAGRGLLSFGIVVTLWSVAAVTFTLTEALNTAYGVKETNSRRKRFVFALVFGPFLALAFILASGLVLIGPRVAGWLAGLAGLDEAWVAFWGWRHSSPFTQPRQKVVLQSSDTEFLLRIASVHLGCGPQTV